MRFGAGADGFVSGRLAVRILAARRPTFTFLIAIFHRKLIRVIYTEFINDIKGIVSRD